MPCMYLSSSLSCLVYLPLEESSSSEHIQTEASTTQRHHQTPDNRNHKDSSKKKDKTRIAETKKRSVTI